MNGLVRKTRLTQASLALVLTLSTVDVSATDLDCPWVDDNKVGNLQRCLARAGERSNQRARDASEEGNAHERRAISSAEKADVLRRDREAAESKLGALSMEQARNFLAQPYQPPESFRKEFRALGLSTTRDLLEKGGHFEKRYAELAEGSASQAQENYLDSSRAHAAAGKFKTLDSKIRQVQARMDSAQGARAVPARLEASEESGAEIIKGKPNHSSGLTAGAFPDAPGSSGTRKSSGADPDRSLSTQTSTEFRLDSAGKGKRSSKPSLRDIIKARLAAARARGDSAAVAQGEEELKKLTEREARAPASSRSPAFDASDENELRAKEGFSLASSGTDNAVASILIDFETELSRNRGDGNELSLFARIKKSIKACLANRCVGPAP